MKIAARRRLAGGVLATTTALFAGVLIVPAVAAPGGLVLSPSGAVNTDPAADVAFDSTDADFFYGGTAIFQRLGTSSTFDAPIDGGTDTPPPDREGTATIDLTDVDGANETGAENVVGIDGPADSGTYSVTANGAAAPLGAPAGGGGTDTCTSCFTVLSPGPVAVDSVAPNSLRPGGTGDVSILGNNFERSTQVQILFPSGGVDTSVTTNGNPVDETDQNSQIEDGVTTRKELLRRFTVAAGAQPGVRDVRVTNLDGSTDVCESCFFVAGPSLTSVTPTAAFNDPTQTLTTITFTGPTVTFGEPRLEFVGDPGAVSRSALAVTGTNVRDYTGTSITADFDLANAAPGSYQPFVEGDNGIVNACDTCRFTVIQRDTRMPTLTGLDRSTLAGVQKNLRQGETAQFVATGTNFSRGATLVFDASATGLTVTDVEFVTPEKLEVTIAAAADAATGDRDVQVRLSGTPQSGTANGATSAICDNCLTVTPGSGATPSPTATASASPAPGNSEFEFGRFAGQDRYTTAALIATGSYSTAETVLLANGQSDDPRTTKNESHFPDALAAAYLAGNRKAPTLLTMETDLPTATENALSRLQAKNVVIIGGPSAVSATVEDELKGKGYAVSRVAGQNRWSTAQAVAQTPAISYVGENPDGKKTAIVASGEGFADALVAGPLAYAAQFPVLLTAKASLPEATSEALDQLEIAHVLIPGGDAVVSPEVEDRIKAMGITTQRFAGQNRSETATLVAAYAYDALNFNDAHVDLATGAQFPDALAGGPHAGEKRSAILLAANKDDIGRATEAFLRQRGSRFQEGDIFGGTTAVSLKAEEQAENAIAGQSTASPSPSTSASATPTGSATPSSTASASPTGSPTCQPNILGGGCPEPSASPTATASATPSA